MGKLDKRYIGGNEVGSAQIRLENNQSLRFRNAANTADIQGFKVDATDKLQVLVPLHLSAVASDALHAVRFDQFDAAISGLASDIADEISRAQAAEGVLQGNIDAEEASRIAADASLQSQLSAIAGGFAFSYGAKAITSDADLRTAVEGDSLAALLPFSDDEGTTLAIGDFSANDYLISEDGASSRIFKIYDDAGTLKLTLVDVEQPSSGKGYLVRFDIINTPADKETTAIYAFGTSMTRVGSVNWNFADGIKLSASFGASAIVGMVAGDTIEQALTKIEAAFAAAAIALQDGLDAEEAARIAADELLQDNIDAEATARAAADTALQSNIDAEATARAAADTVLQGNIDSEASTRASADADLQSQIDALELINSTPENQIRYVSKSGNDSTGTGSQAQPFLTVEAATASITDAYYNSASDFKRYVIVIGPGRFVMAGGSELKSHITYAHMGSRGACTLQIASGDIVWNAANEVQPKLNLHNIAIFSNITINSAVAGANAAVLETYHVFTTGLVTVNQTASGFTNIQGRYSRFGAITTVGTNGGYVSTTLEYCFHGQINHGPTTPANDQGSLQLVNCWSGVGASGTVNVNGASLYVYNTLVDIVNIDAKGFANEFLHTGNIATTKNVVGLITEVRLSNVEHLKYVAAVSGNYNVVPSNPKMALDELAARIKSLETDLATLESEVDALSLTVSDHTASIADHESRITSLESDVAQLQSDLTALDTVVDGHTSDIAALDTRLDTAESDIDTLQSQVASLQAQAVTYEKETIALDSGKITAGYIDLANEYYAKSLLIMNAPRVPLFEGLDYTVSVVGGVTRVTFAGPSAVGGDEALVASDILYISGAKVS